MARSQDDTKKIKIRGQHTSGKLDYEDQDLQEACYTAMKNTSKKDQVSYNGKDRYT